MAASKSPGSMGLLKVSLILFIFELVVLFLVIPPSWLYKIAEKEHIYLVQEMGVPTAEWVTQAGRTWYGGMVVETGLSADVQEFFGTDPATEVISGPISGWLNERALSFQIIAQQVLQRVALVYSWIFFIVLLGFPFILDGIMGRKIKQYSFAHTSTAARSIATSALGLIAVVFIMAIFAPIPFHPGVIPVLMLLAMFAMNVAISHTQKEL